MQPGNTDSLSTDASRVAALEVGLSFFSFRFNEVGEEGHLGHILHKWHVDFKINRIWRVRLIKLSALFCPSSQLLIGFTLHIPLNKHN